MQMILFYGMKEQNKMLRPRQKEGINDAFDVSANWRDRDGPNIKEEKTNFQSFSLYVSISSTNPNLKYKEIPFTQMNVYTNCTLLHYSHTSALSGNCRSMAQEQVIRTVHKIKQPAASELVFYNR